MQTDPIGQDGGLNLYAYVGGDPVNAIDPLGLDQQRPNCLPPSCTTSPPVPVTTPGRPGPQGPQVPLSGMDYVNTVIDRGQRIAQVGQRTLREPPPPLSDSDVEIVVQPLPRPTPPPLPWWMRLGGGLGGAALYWILVPEETSSTDTCTAQPQLCAARPPRQFPHCDAQWEADQNQCFANHPPGSWQLRGCIGRAEDRYMACRRGGPIPPPWGPDDEEGPGG